MKQTVFEYTLNEEKKTHTVDFVYNPLNTIRIGENDFVVRDAYDEFTDNPLVQIRHILLAPAPSKQIL